MAARSREKRKREMVPAIDTMGRFPALRREGDAKSCAHRDFNPLAAPVMKFVVDCLQVLWVAALFAGMTAGWGGWVVRRLRLPPEFCVPAGLVVYGMGALAVFFGYVASSVGGRSLALGWGAAGAWMLWREWRDAEGRRVLCSRNAWVPPLLALILTAGWLALLFVFDAPSGQRFTAWPLPTDDRIPRELADRLAAGASLKPFEDGWLSSDRPPLQTAIVLSVRAWCPFGRSEFNYQVIGTFLQVMWLPVFCAIGRALALRRNQMRFAILAMATSGFFLLNSIFVWPKLLAASLFLTALAVILTEHDAKERGQCRAGFAGAAMAVATLAHASVFFSLLALPFLPASWRFLRRAGIRGALWGVLAFVAIQLPWTAYQNFYDPPGNHLLKWHLAGVIPVDSRTFAQTLKEEYGKLSGPDWRAAREANLRALAGWPWYHEKGRSVAQDVVRIQFFHLLPAADLLVFGFVGIFAGIVGDGADLRAIRRLGLYVLATILLWVTLMFLPGSTVNHQGSFAATGLVFFIGAIGLTGWPRWLRWAGFGLHLVIFCGAWINTVPAGGGGRFHGIEALLALLFGLLFLHGLRWLPEAGRPEGASAAG
jgi:hypothetical protein